MAANFEILWLDFCVLPKNKKLGFKFFIHCLSLPLAHITVAQIQLAVCKLWMLE